MTYGVPYMGSKSKIAREVVDCLPPAETFVDLFAGGCAITHAAMLSNGKYKRFLVNDIDWRGVTLFRDAIMGRYKDEKRVITREMFNELKETDAYVALCWSFGNNPDKGYLWSEENEKVKTKAMSMLMAETWQERLAFYRDFTKYVLNMGEEYTEVNNPNLLESLQRLERIQGLERLERIQGLERLERIQGLERLETSISSYDKVNIPKDACVYCDIPYYGTSTYSKSDFNHNDFYQWTRTREYPVFVSEYTMPSDFKSVWADKKQVALCATDNSKKAVEKLFVHEKWYDKIHKNDLFGFED